MLTLHRHADARAFLARAESWLATREIEHAGVLQSARQARANDAHYERPIYWATIEDDGELIGCAYRTPPYKIGVTALPESAIAPLVADLAATYPTAIGGFSGPDPTVSEVATAWVRQRGGSWTVNTRGRLLSFARQTEPPSLDATTGVLRLASAADNALAQSWGGAASIDSGIAALDGRMCLQLLAAKLLYFWSDDRPRCMIGLLHETRTAAAVGIVYTPAAFRGQGYATAALHALNNLLDERGVANRYLWIEPKSDAAQALAHKLGCRFVYDSVDIDCA
jgi:GNAT superfamily N-acetyltransferase